MHHLAHHDSIKFFYTLMAGHSIISDRTILHWADREPSFASPDEAHLISQLSFCGTMDLIVFALAWFRQGKGNQLTGKIFARPYNRIAEVHRQKFQTSNCWQKDGIE